MLKIPHHEFWPGRLYETPGYLYLLWLGCLYRVGLKTLFKANYGLPYGGASFASKYKIQQYIGGDKFPTTIFLSQKKPEKHLILLKEFTAKEGYPIILKPDYGFTGRGVFKVENEAQLKTVLPFLNVDYLAQTFVASTIECGVFFIRLNGKKFISSVNQKHFPTVVGDGLSTLKQLVDQHPRYNHFWKSYLTQHNLNQVLEKDAHYRLSDVGSHTLGCCFTHDPNLITPALETAVFTIFEKVPGFNYGRLDLLAKDLESFKAGQFAMVEANGIDSLPTNIFDPQLKTWPSYLILFAHLKKLVQVANENRQYPNESINIWSFIKQSLKAKKSVEMQQTALESLPDLSRL